MKVADVAKHYLNYWHVDAHGNWNPADNAPSALWQFVLSRPKGTDRNLIYCALKGLATDTVPDDPPADKILKWFAEHPQATAYCDSVLREKRKPKDFNDLITRAYNQAAFSVIDDVYSFLLGHINKK